MQFFLINEGEMPKISIHKNLTILFRGYNLQDQKEKLKIISKYCKQKKIPLIIAKNLNMVDKYRAIGLHLPYYLAGKSKNIKRARKKLLITSSAHDLKELMALNQLPVDIVFFSKIFPSKSYDCKNKYHGILKSRRLILKSNKKIVALGGVTRYLLRDISSLPVFGVAGRNL